MNGGISCSHVTKKCFYNTSLRQFMKREPGTRLNTENILHGDQFDGSGIYTRQKAGSRSFWAEESLVFDTEDT